MTQGPSLRGPATVTQGGVIDIEVSSGSETVEVSVAFGDPPTSYKVGPDGSVSIPAPQAPGGTIIIVSVGKGLTARRITIEIVAPSP